MIKLLPYICIDVCSIQLKYKVKHMQIIDLEDNIGNEQSLNILCFLKPDSVSYVVRNVQFTISLAYSDDFYCFFVM